MRSGLIATTGHVEKNEESLDWAATDVPGGGEHPD
jgi:hypothetical protein